MLGNLDKYQIILASNSPRRKELMSGLGVDTNIVGFSIISPSNGRAE